MTQAETTNPGLLYITTDQLTHDSHNSRRSKPTKASLQELIASIRAHGLLENLIVTPIGKGAQYGVVAGARRLAALKIIEKEDGGDPFEVPCLVLDAGTDAHLLETSLAENAVRLPMHPADQVEAFAKLAKAGASPDDIAVRFGVAVRTVQRRLRLGGLHATILTAWRNGEIREDAVWALGTASDQKQAKRVFDDLRKNHLLFSHHIRNAMSGTGLRGDERLARFVGVDAYRAAGGQLHDELFFGDADESTLRFLDVDLVQTLALDTLQAAADAEREDGWKWSRAELEVSWSQANAYERDRVLPHVPDYTAAEKKERKTLYNKLERLAEKADAGDDDGKLFEQQEAAERRIEEIEYQRDERATYDARDKRIAGVVFTVDEDARLHAIRGIVEEDEQRAREAEDGIGIDDNKQPSTAAAPRTAAAEPEDDEAKPWSDSLRQDMTQVRKACIARALAEHPRLAIDALGFALARQGRIGNVHGYESHAVFISQGGHFEARSDALKTCKGVVDPHVSPTVAKSGFRDGNPAEGFKAFLHLPQETRDTVIAHAVADKLVTGAPLEVLVEALDIDFPVRLAEVGVHPWPAELVWNRLSKAQIMEVARAELGEEWVQTHIMLKKGELAAAAEAAFAERPDWLPPVGFGG